MKTSNGTIGGFTQKIFHQPCLDFPFQKRDFPMPLAFLNLRWPQLGRGPVPVAEGLHLKNRFLREFLEAEDGKFGRNHVNLRGYAQDIRLHTRGYDAHHCPAKLIPDFFRPAISRGFKVALGEATPRFPWKQPHFVDVHFKKRMFSSLSFQ